MAENEMIKDTAPLPEEQPEAVSEEILAEHPEIPAENYVRLKTVPWDKGNMWV